MQQVKETKYLAIINKSIKKLGFNNYEDLKLEINRLEKSVEKKKKYNNRSKKQEKLLEKYLEIKSKYEYIIAEQKEKKNKIKLLSIFALLNLLIMGILMSCGF